MNQRQIRLIAVAIAASCLNACGTEQGSESKETGLASSPVSANGVDATLSYASDWGNGYCANVTLTNKGTAPVSNWSLVVAMNQVDGIIVVERQLHGEQRTADRQARRLQCSDRRWSVRVLRVLCQCASSR